VSPAKTVAPIEMPFGFWARMGCRNHVLDGAPEVLMDVAMATDFGTQFAVTGFVGYNFGCMIASDTLLILRVGFRGQAIRRRHSRDRVSKGRCHGNHFWLSIYGVHIGATWRIRLNRPCAAAMRPYVKLL